MYISEKMTAFAGAGYFNGNLNGYAPGLPGRPGT